MVSGICKRRAAASTVNATRSEVETQIAANIRANAIVSQVLGARRAMFVSTVSMDSRCKDAKVIFHSTFRIGEHGNNLDCFQNVMHARMRPTIVIQNRDDVFVRR